MTACETPRTRPKNPLAGDRTTAGDAFGPETRQKCVNLMSVRICHCHSAALKQQ